VKKEVSYARRNQLPISDLAKPAHDLDVEARYQRLWVSRCRRWRGGWAENDFGRIWRPNIKSGGI